MFTHPSLLRQLTLTADQLRRAGETAWARRLVGAADEIRKLGWTDQGRLRLFSIFDAEPRLDSLQLGAEHERRLGGPSGVSLANSALSEMRIKIRELATHPTKDTPSPGAARQRSPDLG